MAQLATSFVQALPPKRATRLSVRKRYWPARGASLPRPRLRLELVLEGTGRSTHNPRCPRRPDDVAACPSRLELRRLLLLGRLDEAAHACRVRRGLLFPPASRTIHELVIAGIAIGASGQKRPPPRSPPPGRPPRRTSSPRSRRSAKRRASRRRMAQNDSCCSKTSSSYWRRNSDTCRHMSCAESRTVVPTVVPLASRPVLFALARALAEAWPGGVPRKCSSPALSGARLVE